MSVDQGKNETQTEDGWTVQSSKPRRLAPQWSLKREDMGPDSLKSKAAASQETLTSLRMRGKHQLLNNRSGTLEFLINQYFPPTLAVKRFTKEELLAARRKSRELTHSINMHPDIISLEPLEPVCTTGVDVEEVCV